MIPSASEQPSGSTRRIVSDTGPLISLEKLTGGFQFIRRLYGRIIVPLTVLEEVGSHYDQAEAYLEHCRINERIYEQLVEALESNA